MDNSAGKQIGTQGATFQREGGGLFSHIKADFRASIVVFLVALPLSMGIAIASGAPVITGLISGVIGGIVVGLLAGAPLQVSGPAAGLTVIVATFITNHGLGALGAVVLLAGLFQLIAGILRLGQWFRAVSPAVIHGMLAGIGILIFAGQFHVMVDDKASPSGITNLLTIPQAVWKGIFPLDGSSHHLAAGIGLLTILVLLGWQYWLPKRLRVIPGPLAAVITAAVAAYLVGLHDRILFVELPADILGAIAIPTSETWSYMTNWAIIGSAAAIALIASAETLLCATAVDRLHNGPRTRYDRELLAQGVGNMACGFFSALPITGVIVRSAANVEAGAKTPLSAILHGVWLVILVLAFPWLLQLIPISALAAILVYTGYKLVNVKAIRELAKVGYSELAIYIVTVTLIVVEDLLIGVAAGVALSVVKLLYNFSHLRVQLNSDPATQRSLLKLEGAATFLRLPRLAAAIEQVPPGHELHVTFEQLSYIDHACLDLLINWERQHAETGGKLVIDWNSLTARFQPAGGATSESEEEKLARSAA